MKTSFVISSIVLVVCAAGALAIAIRTHRTKNAQAEKLDRFCQATKMVIHGEAIYFLNGSADDQAAAEKRFWSREIYEGVESIAYCLDESKIPKMPLACPMADDQRARWKCLGDFAATVENALP